MSRHDIQLRDQVVTILAKEAINGTKLTLGKLEEAISLAGHGETMWLPMGRRSLTCIFCPRIENVKSTYAIAKHSEDELLEIQELVRLRRKWKIDKRG